MKRLPYILPILAFFFPFVANAAVTLNSFTWSQPAPASLSATVPSMTNGLSVCYIGNGNNSSTVTGLTFGSVAFTLLDQFSTNSHPFTTFYALNVPSGAQTGSATFSGTAPADVYFGCWFLDGVDQTTPIDAHNSSANNSVSVTTSNSAFFVGVMFDGGNTGANITSHQSGATIYFGQDSNGMVAAGSNTNTWTGATAGSAIVAVNQVLPSPAAPYLPLLSWFFWW